jgi:prepilin-type N-terminal cleavage/methylation domain-containing protein
MKPRRSANMRGFTLIEVLVSTVLLASVFVAVVSLSSQSLRNLSKMQPHERALSHAREKMNQLLLLEELQPGASSGSWEDGYRWEAVISSNTYSAKSSGAGYGLFNIRLLISWGLAPDDKTYVVETTQWAKRVASNASR